MPQICPVRPVLRGDTPKQILDDDDKFGFGEIAKALADVVSSRISANGYIIGIEGKWGSGKTTLLNFVSRVLSAKSNKEKFYKIIRFEPWLIGKRETLLRVFFDEIIKKIEELKADYSQVESCKQTAFKLCDKLVAQIRQYEKGLDFAAASAFKLANFDPTGRWRLVACLLWMTTRLVKFLEKKKLTLETLKANVVSSLNQLNEVCPKLIDARIIILIDDTDRLDPADAVEILRLIKAVADFPLISYLVCFDREILSQQVKESLKVESGETYLEKIFQQIISIPPQEAFALRRYVNDQISKTFPGRLDSPRSEDMEFAYRRETLFDVWLGHFIQTPREANNLLEAIKLGWPYVEDKVDFLDFVWLQLLKIRCPSLYNWVKDYVVSLGALRDGGRPGDRAPLTEAAKLRKIIKNAELESDFYRVGLRYFLPGLRNFMIDEEKSKVLEFIPSDELSSFEKDFRLGSPSHWRYFFAFDKPSYALDDDDLLRFKQLVVQDGNKAAEMLLILAKQETPILGYKLDVFLDRLVDRNINFLPEEQIGLAKVFSQIMDDVPIAQGLGLSGIDPWRKAAKLLSKEINGYAIQMMETGLSINWLSFILRDQAFALGIIDKNRTYPERQWMSENVFNSVKPYLLKRLEKMPLEEILNKPDPLQILFCWKQLGDKAKLQTLVSDFTKDDMRFLTFLNGLRSTVISSNRGAYMALRADVVKEFLDVTRSRERLEEMLSNTTLPVLERAKAEELLKDWD